MRVISGSAKGRPLKAVPGNGTRPTTDKVKEAMFSIIGPYFDGGQVLDLFAGTGGLGIEALSRGMEHGVFIDMEYKSIEIIKANVQSAKLTEQAEIYRNEAGRALKVLQKRGTAFDLVFLDPPYRMKNGIELMQDMHERGLLKQDATIVLEFETGHPYPTECDHFVGVRQAEYGETTLYIYRYAPDSTSTLEEQGSHAQETQHEVQQGGTLDE
ncbi:16S rRNA (guanine(966)-N(2))-methyltransferase RsmD [Paenibacillus wenxiniae]|uniref:16S rRNA (Guanine(966)-N(2))-methyltransferase RsmD n=1 Tax=Paenibacillus wenxiniae TaxID=1636843 RepID=A0ABW4RQ46_9BACL